MQHLFKLLGLIEIDNKNANKALDETSGKGAQAESKLGKAFGAIGKGALAVGKAVGAGMVAAGTAVAGIVTQSTQSYAQYEQLVGGVETLFEDSASKVLEYANKAFQTAGMSANEYMETVTSFSASLLQSLGGDTAAAADTADMAIRDMSDNANKMGTSMESIQNAYQGFAKQNYTMLDNLKLGYGGTKTEMERLLKDAEKLSGIKYDISSYADIVEAIHVVQTEMGITGTTAAEASGTISGSFASVKASWANLVTAMADDGADLGSYIDTFVGQAATALENLMPRIGIALEGVVQLVDQLAPVIIDKIPGLLSQLLPSIIDASVGLVNSVVSILPQLVEMLVNTALPQLIQAAVTICVTLAQALPQVLQILWNTITEQAPTLFAAVGSMLEGAAQHIQDNLPIIVEKARELMEGFGAKIKENLPVVISKALDILLGLSSSLLENLPVLVSAGMDLLMSLAQGLISALPELIAKAPQIIINFADSISSSMTVIFAKGLEIIWALIKGIIGAIPDLIRNFPKVIEAIFSVWNAINWTNMGKNLINGITNGIKNMGGSLKTAAQNVFNGLKNAIKNPMEAARTLVKGVLDKIKGLFNFKISWPKIPMPKFAITPKGWEIGDLLKGKIPKLGIDWYAKAMNDPVIMEKPAIFGYNGSTGNLMGGGEAGSEVVSGTNTLMNMIQGAVAAQNEGIAAYLQMLIDMLSSYFPEALEAMRTPATFDPNYAAKALAAPMNRELGIIYARKDRGR